MSLEEEIEQRFQKEILLNAGMTVDGMTDTEIAELSKTIFESTDKNYEQELQKFIKKNLKEAKQATNHEAEISFSTAPKKLSIFNISNSRNLLPDIDIYKNRGFDSIEELNLFRRELVKSLVIANDSNYNSSIRSLAASTLKFGYGPLISILLHDGTRIEQRFNPEGSSRLLYIWAASSEPLLRDQIPLGDFIIIQPDGKEIDPNSCIGDNIKTTFCFNLRVFL